MTHGMMVVMILTAFAAGRISHKKSVCSVLSEFNDVDVLPVRDVKKLLVGELNGT
jgi:hypothetical protein